MWKYTVQVNGMMCGMCESHVNDAVQDALRAAISATGYEVGEIRKEPWEKKGLFGR